MKPVYLYFDTCHLGNVSYHSCKAQVSRVDNDPSASSRVSGRDVMVHETDEGAKFTSLHSWVLTPSNEVHDDRY